MYAVGDDAHNQTFLSFQAGATKSRRDSVDERVQPGVGIEVDSALKTSVVQSLAHASLRRCALSGDESICAGKKVHEFFTRESGACRERVRHRWMNEAMQSAFLEAVLMVRSRSRTENARRTVAPAMEGDGLR